ncbi:MAG: alpha/beta hydrolase [Gammaproteobacteria bacterium]|nr:alpha/beta hydrolase [Gammaproteobacteria bacterium]
MQHSFIEANGLQLCYDEFGTAGRPTVILVMGLGTQMISWPEPFCQRIADGGYRVIRFDNRDIGLSQKLDGEKIPGLLQMMIAGRLGLSFRVPYTLADMAADTVGLMDALGVARAHLVGVSMGGMVSQLVSSEFSHRVLSLTSIMSSSGARHLPGASAQIRRHMMRRAPPGENNYLRHAMRTWQLIGSKAYPPDPDALRERLLTAYRRSYYPQGYLRQMAAILASGDRVELLRSLRLPTLVIHGTDDPLVPVEAGVHTAELVPNSRLELIEGMGHDLPRQLLTKLADLILEQTNSVESKAA